METPAAGGNIGRNAGDDRGLGPVCQDRVARIRLRFQLQADGASREGAQVNLPLLPSRRLDCLLVQDLRRFRRRLFKRKNAYPERGAAPRLRIPYRIGETQHKRRRGR